MAVALAVIRGFTAAKGTTLGSFWVDLRRSVVWVLLPLPLSVVLALPLPLPLSAVPALFLA